MKRWIGALSLVGLALMSACGTTPATDPIAAANSPSPTPSSPSPTGTKDCTYVDTGDPARPVKPPSEYDVAKTGTVQYVITTNEGDITLTMDRAKTPCTVNSFVSLADQGFYDKTTCPRMVATGLFILQCGDPTGTTSGGPGYTFADELTGKEKYTAGTVAMANAGPNTNGSQFFFVFKDSDLPPDYTVFGSIDEKSLEVVKKITAAGQDGGDPYQGGKPKNPANIISVKPKS